MSTEIKKWTIEQRFPYMQEAGELRESLSKQGLYVELEDIAAGLFGKAYDEATKEFRYVVRARPVEVGDGMSIKLYTDVTACTVIARTAKTLTLQEDEAKLLNGPDSGEKDALTFEPGGFVGHTSGRQRYAYTRDENGAKFTARLTKKGWSVPGYIATYSGRMKHYDYNF